MAMLRQQRGEAEATLQRERAQKSGKQTAAELQEMIVALQARQPALQSILQPAQLNTHALLAWVTIWPASCDEGHVYVTMQTEVAALKGTLDKHKGLPAELEAGKQEFRQIPF